MSDLLERLREESLQLARRSFDSVDAGISANLCDAAIDEIESLRAQLSSARKALEDILEVEREFRNSMPEGWDGDPLQDACDAAEKLLKESAK